MAENSNMPLAGELGLINYLQGLFSNKVANPNYTGGTVPAPVLAPTMSGQDMSNIMTEFLRGNGQFMDQMRQQNLSGLYNSSTQKLVANDLTAQAALKASLANQNIQQGNAQILNNYNARVAAQAPKYLPNQAGGAGKALAALGVAGLGKLLGGSVEEALGGKKSKSKSGGTDTSVGSAPSSGNTDPLTAAAEAFSGAFGELIPNDFGMDVSPIAEAMPEVASQTFDIGNAMSGLDLSGVTDTLANLELPDFDFEMPDFDLGDFDFLDIGSWFS